MLLKTQSLFKVKMLELICFIVQKIQNPTASTLVDTKSLAVYLYVDDIF
jgi:hypothetical protein